jgi:hypothetical protein
MKMRNGGANSLTNANSSSTPVHTGSSSNSNGSVLHRSTPQQHVNGTGSGSAQSTSTGGTPGYGAPALPFPPLPPEAGRAVSGGGSTSAGFATQQQQQQQRPSREQRNSDRPMR